MNDLSKISASHLGRAAYIYLRQSTPAQVEHNRESTQRQYALASKASTLGWPSQQVVVIDEDLGLSGSGVVARNGFARLTAEVALGHVGIVLGLEVSRLARNNADWYRLLDLCGLTNTLIGDADGVYHPAMFNDRLLLGRKRRLRPIRKDLEGRIATRWRNGLQSVDHRVANRWSRDCGSRDGELRGASERPWHELVDPRLRVTGRDRSERRFHPGVGLDVIYLARRNERSYASP